MADIAREHDGCGYTEFGATFFFFPSYPEGFGLEPKPRINPYHQVFLSPSEEVKDKKEEGLPSLGDGTFCRVSCVGVRWAAAVAV